MGIVQDEMPQVSVLSQQQKAICFGGKGDISNRTDSSRDLEKGLLGSHVVEGNLAPGRDAQKLLVALRRSDLQHRSRMRLQLVNLAIGPFLAILHLEPGAHLAVPIAHRDRNISQDEGQRGYRSTLLSSGENISQRRSFIYASQPPFTDFPDVVSHQQLSAFGVDQNCCRLPFEFPAQVVDLRR